MKYIKRVNAINMIFRNPDYTYSVGLGCDLMRGRFFDGPRAHFGWYHGTLPAVYKIAKKYKPRPDEEQSYLNTIEDTKALANTYREDMAYGKSCRCCSQECLCKDCTNTSCHMNCYICKRTTVQCEGYKG